MTVSAFLKKALYTVYTFTWLWEAPVLGRGKAPGRSGPGQGCEVCEAAEAQCLWEEAAASLAGCVAFGLCSRKHSSEYNQSSISPEPT